MPQTPEEKEATAVEFHRARARFPRVVGAIDCTHVRLQSPACGAHPVLEQLASCRDGILGPSVKFYEDFFPKC
ncbi:hypothetical protein QE152_g5835 [Popillia japonica]|uniref:Nuclease HARBI1 n=1 Tax=Popillia japonica TaxID=7064 RepID=A0AAW1MKA4_POPJA